MDLVTLRREIGKQPFTPFHLRLSDGTRVLVKHPDFIAVAPPREVFVGKEDGGAEIIDLLHIVAIDRSHDARTRRKPKGGNGR